MSVAVVLFTRDLRVRDQPALAAAMREHGDRVPNYARLLEFRRRRGLSGVS